MDLLDYITGRHSLYNRYIREWKLCRDSYYGGTEYRRGKYLRQYAGDVNTQGETINTYVTTPDGAVIGKTTATITHSQDSNEESTESNFYQEKLDSTPLYNYVKLIVSEYNSILFRNAPQRDLPISKELEDFIINVDGEGNSLNEFMALVDTYTTIYGVCHISCLKPEGSVFPLWRIHRPEEVTNWEYSYKADGTLALQSIVIELDDADTHTVYRHITKDKFETVFVGKDDDFVPNIESDDLQDLGDGAWLISQPNEMGYIPVQTVYQSVKVYNNIGTTIIQDVAQIQRSIYGDLAEIYSAITYSSHPVLTIDEATDQLNGGNVGAEPGAKVIVPTSMTGEKNHTFEFKAPELTAISEIRELIDNKVGKLSAIAMLRSEDMVKSSRSGEQIEQYDDKLAALIRRKATNLENAEHHLWVIWFDWMNISHEPVISYNRQYNKRALETEIAELTSLMDAYVRYIEIFGPSPEGSEIQEKLQLRLVQLLMSTSTENGI